MSKMSTVLASVYRNHSLSVALIAGYLVLLHGALGAVLLQFDVAPKALERLNMAVALHRHADVMAKHHRAVERPVVLIGDSNMWLFGQARYTVNHGISGETTAGLLHSMPLYAPDVRRASAVLMMIGVNDLWQHKTEGMTANLQGIMAAVPTGVPLIWSSILPSKDFRIEPSDIVKANATIHGLCDARPGCVYIDTAKFLSKDGEQIPDYFKEDGVHLSADGYEQWIGAMQVALDEIHGGEADQ